MTRFARSVGTHSLLVHVCSKWGEVALVGTTVRGVHSHGAGEHLRGSVRAVVAWLADVALGCISCTRIGAWRTEGAVGGSVEGGEVAWLAGNRVGHLVLGTPGPRGAALGLLGTRVVLVSPRDCDCACDLALSSGVAARLAYQRGGHSGVGTLVASGATLALAGADLVLVGARLANEAVLHALAVGIVPCGTEFLLGQTRVRTLVTHVAPIAEGRLDCVRVGASRTLLALSKPILCGIGTRGAGGGLSLLGSLAGEARRTDNALVSDVVVVKPSQAVVEGRGGEGKGSDQEHKFESLHF